MNKLMQLQAKLNKGETIEISDLQMGKPPKKEKEREKV